MFGLFKKMFNEEDGIETVEIVIIIAVLVGIALIFRDAIIKFAVKIMGNVFGDDSLIDEIKSGSIRDGNPIN